MHIRDYLSCLTIPVCLLLRLTCGSHVPDRCYVYEAGCTYRVSLQKIECVSNDEPINWTKGRPALEPPTMDKVEKLEKSLLNKVEGLSSKSLRQIRQIRNELKDMKKAIDKISTDLDDNKTNKKRRKKKRDFEDKHCPPEFLGGGSWPSCYRLLIFNASFQEANTYCEAIGAELVSLETVKEAYIVEYLVKSNRAYQGVEDWWTSGNYIATAYKWMWTGRHFLRPIDYSRWAPGEPNARSTHHCLTLRQGDKYHWHDAMCSDRHGFICETEL